MLYKVRVFIRDYTALFVRRWLLRIIILLSKRYPEPVEENVWHPNARILFRTLQKYLEYEQNTDRKALIQAAFRLVIDEYQRHIFYRSRLDWFVDEIKDWLPRSEKPMVLWSEPRKESGGTIFPTEKLNRIMKAAEPERSVLIQDLILSASDGRIYNDSRSGKEGVEKEKIICHSKSRFYVQ